jgi:hypothetical protein
MDDKLKPGGSVTNLFMVSKPYRKSACPKDSFEFGSCSLHISFLIPWFPVQMYRPIPPYFLGISTYFSSPNSVISSIMLFLNLPSSFYSF